MASYFIYDSINMYRSDNTVSEGTFSGTTFTASDSLTNHERVADQNIGTAMSGVTANDAICYQVGSAVSADALAMRFSGDCGIGVQDNSENTIRFGTALDGLSGAVNFASGSTVASWRVVTFTEVTSKTKFCVEFNDAQNNISEILIGKKLAFEVEPDVNVQSSIDYENSIQKSLGGVEYAINVNEGQEVHTISFQNISSTFKSDLITMQDALKGEAKKFVWYDGTLFHWVRLDKPMTFTEIADGRFSTQLVLRQQIQ
jgi:hypothetical protein